MSNDEPKLSPNLVAVLVAAVTCFVIAVCAAIFIAVPEGANTGSLIVILLGQLPGTIAGIVALRSANRIETKTDRVLNGEMEAKVKIALANVLQTHLSDSATHGGRRRGD